MTSFSSDGTLGISPEYRQSRIISGCPITAEEEAAIAECRRIYDDPQYRQATTADPPANWGPYWEACRRLEKLRRPAMQAASDQRRADDGVPVTADEIAARARVAEIEDTAPLPRSAETRAALEQATAAWWAAEREAYEIAGVEYPWDDERDGDELDRRRATLSRAKAGLLPLVPAHERTFDDEPDDPVRVPFAHMRRPRGGCIDYDHRLTAAETLEADLRAAQFENEVDRWRAETAAEPLETLPAPPASTEP